MQAAAHRAAAAGRPEAAMALLRQRLQHQPDDAASRLALAQLLAQRGQHAHAAEWLRPLSPLAAAACVPSPRQALTWARTAEEVGAIPLAAALYERAWHDATLGLDPYIGAARCALKQHLPDEAMRVLERAPAQARHDAADWHFLTGTAHLMRRQWPEAARALGEAMRLRPDHAPTLNNLGIVIKDGLGDRHKARAWFEQAVALAPDFLDAVINLAATLMDGKAHDLERAYELLAPHEARRPEHPLFWHALGQIQHRRKHWPQAWHCYELAHRLAPHDADILANMGIWCFDQKRYDDAVRWLQKALEIDPNLADAQDFLGVTFSHMGRLDLQLPFLEAAVARNPDDGPTRFRLAWNLLGAGNFALGFREYVHRPSRRGATAAPNGTPLATRLPERLDGDRLLLVQDQGIGDEWFFLRFAPALQRRGARLHYFTTSKIAPLVQRLGWFEEVWIEPPAAEQFDAAISVGDLPHLLGVQDDDPLPPPIAIEPTAQHRDNAALILRAFGPGPYVGVTWQGGTNFVRSAIQKRLLEKSIPIEAIAAWIPQHATVVALQRQPQAGEVSRLSQALGRPVLDAATFNDDLEQMLGMLAHLDHYYAVSNTNVHLAASLGVTCTVFVPTPPEWRWMLGACRT